MLEDCEDNIFLFTTLYYYVCETKCLTLIYKGHSVIDGRFGHASNTLMSLLVPQMREISKSCDFPNRIDTTIYG